LKSDKLGVEGAISLREVESEGLKSLDIEADIGVRSHGMLQKDPWS